MKNDVVSIIRDVAVELGWTAQERARSGITLIAPTPNSSVQITMPATGQSVKAGVSKSWMRKVMRYGDPMKRTQMLANVLTRRPDMADLIPWEDYKSPPTPVYDPPKPKPEKARGTITLETLMPECIEPERPSEPKIVSERPYMAHKNASVNGGMRYQSPTTIERSWSDGTTDYQCAWPGCEYANANHLSVRSHYQRSKDHAPVDPETQNATVRDMQYLSPLSRRQAARVERWEKRLAKAMEGLDRTAEDFPTLLAERMVADAGDSTTDGSGEPLTAEQIVERVRRLVDGGVYLAAQERSEELEARIVTLEHEVARANELARTARERWEALADLVREESNHDNEEVVTS